MLSSVAKWLGEFALSWLFNWLTTRYKLKQKINKVKGFNLFGKIPVKFEKVRYNNLDFIVQEMEGHKILSVKIIINEVKPEENAAKAKTR